MSFAGGSPGFRAMQALVEAQATHLSVADKDWAAAAGMIVKKLLVSGGQTAGSLNLLRSAVGEEIFEAQLKSLSHHQAKLLARRLDKTAPDIELSTARAAIAWIRTILAPAPAAEETPPAAEDTPPAQATPAETEEAPAEASEKTGSEPVEASGDEPPPSPPSGPNLYFGRKSFRTG